MDKPSIADVARKAGVSVEMASRVAACSPLAGRDARERVERALSELGHIPAPLPRTSSIRLDPSIALVHASGGDGPVDLPSVIAAVQDALDGSQHALIVQRFDTARRTLTRDFTDFLESRRPAGVLILPPLSQHDEIAGLCWEFGSAHVRLASARLDHDPNLVASADRISTTTAVNRLHAMGHRRIAALSGPDGDRTAQERELGYLDAMADHGLDRGASLIAAGDWSFASGMEAGRLLLQISPAPTAILAANDAMAAGALHAARDLGVAVPEELSIAGFGDTPIARQLWPKLSTVSVPLAEMTRTAVLKLIQPDTAERQPCEFLPEWTARGTTGPCSDTGDPQAGNSALFSLSQRG